MFHWPEHADIPTNITEIGVYPDFHWPEHPDIPTNITEIIRSLVHFPASDLLMKLVVSRVREGRRGEGRMGGGVGGGGGRRLVSHVHPKLFIINNTSDLRTDLNKYVSKHGT